MVDTNGRPVRLAVTTGEAHDIQCADWADYPNADERGAAEPMDDEARENMFGAKQYQRR